MSDVVDEYEKNRNGELSDYSYGQLCNDYLMMIPQNVGRKWTPQTLYTSLDDIKKQNDILDSLDASLDTVENDRSKLVQEAQDSGEIPKVFSVKLDVIDDSDTFKKLNRLYEGTRKSMHSCSHLKIKKIYTVQIDSMHEAFEKKGKPMGNVWELWHGTRVSNLLSILKIGLIVPPSNAGHCTGRMFGNGVYFSDQSTKALNYAYGYWGGGRDNNCFMFLADVAMGKYYTPSGPSSRLPMKGYDSTYAIGNKSGVMNNEMIVPHTHQCDLKYLVQFG
jgi:poly [ADP-ribose] polymerase